MNMNFTLSSGRVLELRPNSSSKYATGTTHSTTSGENITILGQVNCKNSGYNFFIIQFPSGETVVWDRYNLVKGEARLDFSKYSFPKPAKHRPLPNSTKQATYKSYSPKDVVSCDTCNAPDHCVYIYKQNGTFLYVGRSKNGARSRWLSHRNKPWYEYATHIYVANAKNKTSSILYEQYYINKHTPKYNKADNRGDNVMWLEGLQELTFVLWKDVAEERKIQKIRDREKYYTESVQKQNHLVVYRSTLETQKNLIPKLNSMYKGNHPHKKSSSNHPYGKNWIPKEIITTNAFVIAKEKEYNNKALHYRSLIRNRRKWKTLWTTTLLEELDSFIMSEYLVIAGHTLEQSETNRLRIQLHIMKNDVSCVCLSKLLSVANCIMDFPPHLYFSLEKAIQELLIICLGINRRLLYKGVITKVTYVEEQTLESYLCMHCLIPLNNSKRQLIHNSFPCDSLCQCNGAKNRLPYHKDC